MVLDQATILVCSRAASFQRGQEYYLEGRVRNLVFDGIVCSANVNGSTRYSVKINLSTLEGTCDCYAFDGSTWCKHMVAVGLSVSQPNLNDQDNLTTGQSQANSRGTTNTLQDMIEQADIDKLRATLLLVVDRLPESYDLINAIFDPGLFSTEQDIIKAAKDYLRSVRSARNWQRLTEAQLLAHEQLDTLAQVVPGTETSVKGLLEAAQYVYKQLESIDDSDGTLQDACYSLGHRAIEIVNDHHDFEPALYGAMSKKSDLPLEAYILEVGDKFVTEKLISRLDKHILKRDEELVNIDQENALYLLIHHFASKGDERLLELLSENSVNKNTKNSVMVSYYEALGEWDKVVKKLWPLRDSYPQKSLLKRALSETKQFDKLIDMQLDEAAHTQDIKGELIKLEHLLKQANKDDQLPDMVERLIADARLRLDQRVWLLMEQKRFKDVAELLIQALNWPKDQIPWVSWTDIPSLVAYLVRQLQVVAPEFSVDVWKELFTQEVDKVGHTTNYLNFQGQGNALMKLGASKLVRDKATSTIKNYPTRKKLVSICQSWLDPET